MKKTLRNLASLANYAEKIGDYELLRRLSYLRRFTPDTIQFKSVYLFTVKPYLTELKGKTL